MKANSKPSGSAKSQTYWVLERKQLRTLVSQRRLEIIDRLVAAGPLSAKELARLVGAQPSALYHHLQQLVRVGLVVEAGHRVVRRRREVLYMTRAPRIRLFRALRDPANAREMLGITTTMTRQMNRDFRRGIRSPEARPSGTLQNLAFARLVASPSPATLRRINQYLAEIGELLFTSTDARYEPLSLAWIMAPVQRANGASGSGRTRSKQSTQRRSASR
jgi:DNA-binding transcriptional ArsR family regulator